MPLPLPRSAVHIFYRDTTTNPASLGAGISQVDIYNTANLPTNDVNYGSVWFNDTWKMTDRLTVNLGLRFEAYRDLFPEQEFAPNGLPQLANWPRITCGRARTTSASSRPGRSTRPW